MDRPEPVKVNRLSPYVRERILTLKDGFSIVNTRRELLRQENIQVTRHAIGKFLKRFEKTGVIYDVKNINRPGILSKEHLDFIDQTIYNDREISTRKDNRSIQVHVWGGISRRGATGLYIFTGSMDSICYQNILGHNLVPFIQATYPDGHRFIQDNDPKHVSVSTRAWMQDNNVNHWPTPPESPDMNPIENIWAAMKLHIRRVKKPTNQEELIDGITEFWQTVTPEMCSRYISHLYKVIPKVVENEGCASGY